MDKGLRKALDRIEKKERRKALKAEKEKKRLKKSGLRSVQQIEKK